MTLKPYILDFGLGFWPNKNHKNKIYKKYKNEWTAKVKSLNMMTQLTYKRLNIIISTNCYKYYSYIVLKLEIR